MPGIRRLRSEGKSTCNTRPHHLAGPTPGSAPASGAVQRDADQTAQNVEDKIPTFTRRWNRGRLSPWLPQDTQDPGSPVCLSHKLQDCERTCRLPGAAKARGRARTRARGWHGGRAGGCYSSPSSTAPQRACRLPPRVRAGFPAPWVSNCDLHAQLIVLTLSELSQVNVDTSHTALGTCVPGPLSQHARRHFPGSHRRERGPSSPSEGQSAPGSLPAWALSPQRPQRGNHDR